MAFLPLKVKTPRFVELLPVPLPVGTGGGRGHPHFGMAGGPGAIGRAMVICEAPAAFVLGLGFPLSMLTVSIRGEETITCLQVLAVW